MLLFGGIFGLRDDTVDLYVYNSDIDANLPSESSTELINNINSSGLFNIIQVSEISNEYDNSTFSRLLIIPDDFESELKNNNAHINLFYDPSDQSSSITLNALNGVVGKLNHDIANSTLPITIEEHNILSNELRFIDFFLPGVIGIAIMSTGVFGTIGTNTKYRKNGVLKKLATTPISKLEWVIGLVIYHAMICVISSFIITTVGILVFNVDVNINLITLFLIFSGALTFPGLGMIISRIVNEEEEADAAGNVVTFPMLFLAGTFFPIDTMPPALQIIAKFLPLTYLNEGLRNAMIIDNINAAFVNGLIIFGIGIVFIVVGSILIDWKNE